MLVLVIPSHTVDIIDYPRAKSHSDQYTNDLNNSYPAHSLVIQIVHTYGDTCTTHQILQQVQI